MNRITLRLATLALASLAACDDPSRAAGPRHSPAEATLARSPAAWSPRPVDISGGEVSEAFDINGFGFAVGNRYDENGMYHAMVWSPGGTAAELPPLGDWGARANAINDDGQVVGVSSSAAANGDGHAFLWTPGVGMTDLGTLFPGVVGAYSEAADVNNRGWVVGRSEINTPNAFLWTPDGGMQNLGTLGGARSEAHAINDNGQVVGVSSNAQGMWRGFLWTAARGMQALPPLPGDDWSGATGINNKGQVVGWSENISTTGSRRAVTWTPKGVVRDLGFAPGMNRAMGAEDINDAGQVVGAGYVPDPRNNGLVALLPFVWTASGGMRLLDLPAGREHGVAHGISNGGQIAGFSSVPYSGGRATLWR